MELLEIEIHGFKSIEHLVFKPERLSVLIGPNGAGKSNFFSFFRLLAALFRGELNDHVARSGGAGYLLFNGREKTKEITARVLFSEFEYILQLVGAEGDKLVPVEEKSRASGMRDFTAGRSGHTLFPGYWDLVTYDFSPTHQTSRIRGRWLTSDALSLKQDGANLAPFLYRLRQQEHIFYERIVRTLQLLLPFFNDFVLEPEYEHILLRYRERGSDVVFDSSQASDGMLRLFALITLLRQPEKSLPPLLLLDEPELGLHPSAIQVLADLLDSVSHHTQIIVATQSALLVDYVPLESIVVVEREAQATTFRRLQPDQLTEWLEEYTLSELWQKNIIGGRPRYGPVASRG